LRRSGQKPMLGKDFSSAIIAEENEGRIVATNENFTNRDTPKVKFFFLPV